MKLWLSKNSEVPVKAQLVAQITLGIASGDLRAGDKLPSTRELARRFGVHQNTVSAAYRLLAADGWVEFRQGSGVFACDGRTTPAGATDLDRLISNFLVEAEALGYPREMVALQLGTALKVRHGTKILVVEEVEPLRKILAAEIAMSTPFEVKGISPGDLDREKLDGVLITALFDEARRLEPHLPTDSGCIYLRTNSPAEAIIGKARPGDAELIAIASGWADFLNLARLFLLSANIHPDSVVNISTGNEGWTRSLNGVSTIICDTVTGAQLLGDERVQVFPIIAAASIAELRARVQFDT